MFSLKIMKYDGGRERIFIGIQRYIKKPILALYGLLFHNTQNHMIMWPNLYGCIKKMKKQRRLFGLQHAHFIILRIMLIILL